MPDNSHDHAARVSRRTAISLGAAGALALLGPFGLPIAVADPQDEDERVTRARRRREAVDAKWKTPNGWPAERDADIGGTVVTRCVAGVSFNVTLAVGAPYLILGHVLRRFSTEIRSLASEDIVGFRKPTRNRRNAEANHASGTAVDILPGSYRGKAEDLFTAYEILVIRDILSSCQGTVGWLNNSNASHFYITKPPSNQKLNDIAQRVLSDEELPFRHAAAHISRG